MSGHPELLHYPIKGEPRGHDLDEFLLMTLDVASHFGVCLPGLKSLAELDSPLLEVFVSREIPYRAMERTEWPWVERAPTQTLFFRADAKGVDAVHELFDGLFNANDRERHWCQEDLHALSLERMTPVWFTVSHENEGYVIAGRDTQDLELGSLLDDYCYPPIERPFRIVVERWERYMREVAPILREL